MLCVCRSCSLVSDLAWCVAVCCSVLQCVAMQCVAECCSGILI